MPKWTESEIEKLKTFVSKGMNSSSISKLKVFEKSTDAIRKMMRRLGIANVGSTIEVPCRSKKIKFPHEVKQRFKSFLSQNWRGNTPQDLSEIWNKENSRFTCDAIKVTATLSVLGLRIPDCEIEAINKLREKEHQIIKENTSNSSCLAEKIKFERIKLMQERIEKNRDIWTGMPLREGVEKRAEQNVQ